MVFFFRCLGFFLHRAISKLISLLSRCGVQQRNIILVSIMFPMEQFEKSYSRHFHSIPLCSLFREWIVLFKVNKRGHYNNPLLFPYRGFKSVLWHKGTISVQRREPFVRCKEGTFYFPREEEQYRYSLHS